MNEFILISVPLLLVLYLAYGRLRAHLKALEEQITAQRLSHANRAKTTACCSRS